MSMEPIRYSLIVQNIIIDLAAKGGKTFRMKCSCDNDNEMTIEIPPSINIMLAIIEGMRENRYHIDTPCQYLHTNALTQVGTQTAHFLTLDAHNNDKCFLHMVGSINNVVLELRIWRD